MKLVGVVIGTVPDKVLNEWLNSLLGSGFMQLRFARGLLEAQELAKEADYVLITRQVLNDHPEAETAELRRQARCRWMVAEEEHGEDLAAAERRSWSFRALGANAAQGMTHADAVVAGDMSLDCRTGLLTLPDRSVWLTPAEFRLLRFLMTYTGQVWSAEELVAVCWGPETGNASVARTHLVRLRRKLEDEPHHPRRVRTVRGVGYKLVVAGRGDDESIAEDEAKLLLRV
ncbi:MAG TPA: helix-turn-helix domain-containing protein [Armatimonadota bacterium]|jgi:DNA-binding winged helix-turn-helix (wHTH) protein